MSDGTENSPASRLDALICSGPEGVGIWLAAVRAGTVDPKQWNLLALGSDLYRKAREEWSVPWLAVTVEFHGYLAQSMGGWSGEQRLITAMHLRTQFIHRMGVDAREELLQLAPIAEWFLGSLPLTLEEAVAKSAHWRSDLPIEERRAFPIKELRALRHIKNRLGVFQQLDQGSLLNAYPAIQAWLAIRANLP
jgi:hypothetical protein